MRNRFVVVLTVALLVMVFGNSTYAQDNGAPQGGGPGAGPGGGPGRGYGMRMNPQFENTMKLMRLTGGIPDLLKDKSHGLTPAQAKQLLAILKPLKDQPKLTPEHAKLVADKLEKVFTKAQIELMDIAMQNRMRSMMERRRSEGGGPRPGGPGGENANNGPGQGQGRSQGQGGPGRHFDPNAFKDFNPFYTKGMQAMANANGGHAGGPGGGRFGHGMMDRMNTMFDGLANRAHGK